MAHSSDNLFVHEAAVTRTESLQVCCLHNGDYIFTAVGATGNEVILRMKEDEVQELREFLGKK